MNKRKKELGVRKILGASSNQLFVNVSKEFLKWVLVSNIIAWPLAYFTMQSWLQNYTYRISFDYLSFVTGAGISVLITLLVISFQIIKAVKENPVDSLRYE